MEIQKTIATELFRLTKMIFVPIYVLTLSTVYRKVVNNKKHTLACIYRLLI
jgi:hypothetical protein